MTKNQNTPVQLTERQRRIADLYEGGLRTQSEVSKELGISRATVARELRHMSEEDFLDAMGAIEPDLRSFAPRLDELTFSTRLTYHMKANWKNVMENFNECYHCPNAHANLCENVLNIESYKIELHEFHQRHRSAGFPPKDAACDYNPGVSEHGDEFSAWYLWPNLALEVYPGGFLNVFHVIPTGPEEVVEHVDFYLFDREPTQQEAAAIKYRHDYVQLEDVALVESVQRGLRSRSYVNGRLMLDDERSDKSEHAVHHIQSLVSRALSPPN